MTEIATTGHRSVLVAAMRAIRPHQWLKNILVFVPLVLAHRVGEPGLLVTTVLAFLSLSLGACAGYVINDLRDREHDRHHPTKRLSPVASGELSTTGAALLTTVLLLGSLAIAIVWLPAGFDGALFAYLLATSAYSMFLKQVTLVDVIALAAMYTLRLVAGGPALGIPLSTWLLAFSMFLFLSLAYAKRYGEITEFANSAVDLTRSQFGGVPTDTTHNRLATPFLGGSLSS